MINRFEGTLEEGGAVTFQLSLKPGKPSATRVRLIRVAPGQELTWKGGVGPPWFMRGTHSWTLSAEGNGQTRVVHGEIFTGLLSFVLQLVGMPAKLKRDYEGLNDKLKARVEG